MKYFIAFVVLFLSQNSFSNTKSEKEVETCSPAREYITTLNYLMDKKEFAVEKPVAMKIADTVSKGCNRAAQNFIFTMDLLTKVEMPTAQALKIATDVASSSYEKGHAFRFILKSSFAPGKLDLPLKDSVNYALKLSVEFEGDAVIARDDFEDIVEYCNENDEFDIPVSTCGQIAYNVAKSTSKFKKSLANDFIELYEYMIEEDGPNMTTADALKNAEMLMTFGPTSKNSFVNAYKFASHKKGLSFTRSKAISFAIDLTKKSFREKN